MKESSCHNAKMVVYCQEVHQLAKMAFSREPMPTGVFASEQYKPSVRYEEPE